MSLSPARPKARLTPTQRIKAIRDLSNDDCRALLDALTTSEDPAFDHALEYAIRARSMNGALDTNRENAIRCAGGPENEAAVVTVAERLHISESPRRHGSEVTPCSYCWSRSGNAIQALRDAGFELVAQIGEVS